MIDRDLTFFLFIFFFFPSCDLAYCMGSNKGESNWANEKSSWWHRYYRFDIFVWIDKWNNLWRCNFSCHQKNVLLLCDVLASLDSIHCCICHILILHHHHVSSLPSKWGWLTEHKTPSNSDRILWSVTDLTSTH